MNRTEGSETKLNTLDIIAAIKQLAAEQKISINRICDNAGLNSKNIWNKFHRGNLYYSDIEKMLSELNYHIEIKPNNSDNQ